MVLTRSPQHTARPASGPDERTSMAPHPGSRSGGPTRPTLDALVLLALLTTTVVLVAVAGAGPVVLAAAGTFVTGCFAMWLKGRGGQQG